MVLSHWANLLLKRKQNILFKSPVHECTDLGSSHTPENSHLTHSYIWNIHSCNESVVRIPVYEHVDVLACLYAIRNLLSRKKHLTVRIRTSKIHTKFLFSLYYKIIPFAYLYHRHTVLLIFSVDTVYHISLLLRSNWTTHLVLSSSSARII